MELGSCLLRALRCHTSRVQNIPDDCKMAARDPSYASNRLTRNTYHGPSLHPYLRREPTRLSNPVDDAREASKPTHEPKWDDLPLSSDESVASETKARDDLGELPPARVTVGKTEDGRDGAGRAGRKPTRKRLYSQQNSPGSDDDIFHSSQSSKTKYRSKTNPLSSQLPSSSMESEPSPPKSKFKPPRSVSVAEDRPPIIAPIIESDPKVPAFVVPKQVDSIPHSHTRKKLTMPGKNRHTGPHRSSSGFQIPLDVQYTRTLSSQDGHQEPPSLPSTAVSSSSLTSKDLMLDDDDSSLSSLTSIPSDGSPSFFTGEELDEQKHTRQEPEESLCPMCKAPVDSGLLREFLATSNQRIREQQRFCEEHKTKTAEKEWSDRGYPRIDWKGLDRRIRRYFPDIDRLLVPNSTSFYRNILAAKLKSGKAQNFRIMMFDDDLDNMSCGYYGTKGASRM